MTDFAVTVCAVFYILSPMFENLENSIRNKELYLLYLEKNLAVEKEIIITSSAFENINLLPLTEIEQFELIDLKTKVASITTINQHIDSLKKRSRSYL